MLPHLPLGSTALSCYHGAMEREPKIIACEVLRKEVEHLNPGYEVEFYEGALHNHPDKLRETLQRCIDETPGERQILLCCGRCSNGTAGLRAGCHRLILPAVDDCISLLLGSRKRYLEEYVDKPGTFYYTRGWVDFIDDPYKEYLKTVPKYGEELARELAHLILQNYTRLVLIETPEMAEVSREVEPYLATVSAFYNLPLERIVGSLRFFNKLLHGPHDDEFIVVEPHGVLEEKLFWDLPRT